VKAQNIITGLTAIKQCDSLFWWCLICIVQNGMQGLNHGGNTRPSRQHDDMFLRKGSLNLDVERNVFEVDAPSPTLISCKCRDMVLQADDD
jgi:hypothetical protein